VPACAEYKWYPIELALGRVSGVISVATAGVILPLDAALAHS
jgi:hypothetical protein